MHRYSRRGNLHSSFATFRGVKRGDLLQAFKVISKCIKYTGVCSLPALSFDEDGAHNAA